MKLKKLIDQQSLEEMAMDSISHKKFGKLGWHNEGGVHKIKRNGKTIFSGTHKEAAKHWSTIKHITESVLTEATFVANYKKGSDRFQLWKSGDKHTLHKQEDGKWAVHSKHNGSTEDVHSGLKADGFRKTKDLKEDEEFLESDKNKLRNLAHQNPEAADAAAALIRAYMDNPKKPIAQVVTKVCEETGIEFDIDEEWRS